MIGLFAVAEMLKLAKSSDSISGKRAETGESQVLRGFLDVFRHWKETLLSSVVGAVAGIIPGLGGETAQFIAYSQASRIPASRENFGKGAVEGVIAADAATNSKVGGSLIPTLLVGIPGSSGMAVLLVLLIAIGVQPGRNLMNENLDLLYLMVWLLVIASVLATAICLAVTPVMARVTKVRSAYIVAPVLVISIFGAYATSNNVGDILVMLGAGELGYLFEKHGYSRSTLIIGFVLGDILERNLLPVSAGHC